jgi:hypothetical protein
MQGILACIDANGACNCSGCLMRVGARARPVHPIETCLSPMTFRLRYVRQSRLFPLFAILGKIGN